MDTGQCGLVTFVADEYETNGTCTYMSKEGYNIHDVNSNEKWSGLVATAPGEGGKFCASDLWRPWGDAQGTCLMRDTVVRRDLDPVCYKGAKLGLQKRLYYVNNSAANGVENVCPSLTVTGISRDDVISDDVTVGATVNDASGIERVEFYLGEYNGTDFVGYYAQNTVKIDTSAPYNYDFTISLCESGRCAIDIIVYDTNWNTRRYMTWFDIAESDSQDPTVTITSPTSDPTYNVNNSNFNISGSASDDVGVVSVSWSNDRGGSGSCTGTTSWSKTGITLLSGVNVITITAQDAATKTGTDILTVTYSPEFSFSGTSPEGVSLE
jgi:hypothetical protein